MTGADALVTLHRLLPLEGLRVTTLAGRRVVEGVVPGVDAEEEGPDVCLDAADCERLAEAFGVLAREADVMDEPPDGVGVDHGLGFSREGSVNVTMHVDRSVFRQKPVRTDASTPPALTVEEVERSAKAARVTIDTAAAVIEAMAEGDRARQARVIIDGWRQVRAIAEEHGDRDSMVTMDAMCALLEIMGEVDDG